MKIRIVVILKGRKKTAIRQGHTERLLGGFGNFLFIDPNGSYKAFQ